MHWSGANAPTVLGYVGAQVIWGCPLYMAAELPRASVSTFSHRLL